MRVNRGDLIFFDITLLAVRAIFETPTGVARVELAYALNLLTRYPERVRFVVALSNLVRIIPTATVRPYLHAIELAWRSSSSTKSNHSVAKASKFLGVSPQALWPSYSSRNDASVGKRLLSARLFFQAAIRTLSPSNLNAYSRTAKSNVYIHVSGSNIGNPWIQAWLARSPSVRGIFMLHDIIPLTHPEYCPAKVAGRHKSYFARLSRIADVIITNSSYTAETMTTALKTSGIRPPRTLAAPLGVGGVFAEPARTLQAPPYFVYASTIEPRKNHLMLLQIWSRLVQQLGDRAPKLILIGRRGWENENVLDLLERGELRHKHVLECANLCDEVLATLIGNARAALMPSHVEGFGLPVSEALALGVPVIASPLAPFREVAGDVPDYVDPLDGPGWYQAITDYAQENSSRREQQLKRLADFRTPSWTSHFDVVAPMVDELIGASRFPEPKTRNWLPAREPLLQAS